MSLAPSTDELLSCSPETLALIYVTRDDASLLLAQSLTANPEPTTKKDFLRNALVIVRVPDEGFRARTVLGATDSGTLRLSDGSVANMEQLSNSPLGGFSAQQLHSLCCELSWRMKEGEIPQLGRKQVIKCNT